MKNPELLREETIFDKYGKKVITRFYRDSDGKERDFVVWGGKTTPAIIFPVTADKKVIALKMFRRGANESLIEIPGGVSGVGESMEDCARRELFEETGYVGQIIQLSPYLWFEPAACLTRYIPFLALDCKKVKEQKLDETEVGEGMEINLIELDDWFRQIYRGEIRDDKSIALTFLSFPYLELRERERVREIISSLQIP